MNRITIYYENKQTIVFIGSKLIIICVDKPLFSCIVVLHLNGVCVCLISDEETYAGFVQQDFSPGTPTQRTLRGHHTSERTVMFLFSHTQP